MAETSSVLFTFPASLTFKVAVLLLLESTAVKVCPATASVETTDGVKSRTESAVTVLKSIAGASATVNFTELAVSSALDCGLAHSSYSLLPQEARSSAVLAKTNIFFISILVIKKKVCPKVMPKGTHPLKGIFYLLLFYERILTSDVVEVNCVRSLQVTNVLATLSCNAVWEVFSTPIYIPSTISSKLTALTISTC